MAQMKSHDKNTFGGRVAWALELCGGNVLAISKKIGMSHVALGNWKNNKVDSASIGAYNLMRFADETGVQWRWLLTGDGLAVAPPQPIESPIMKRMHLALVAMESTAPYNLERVVQMVEASANLNKPPEQ